MDTRNQARALMMRHTKMIRNRQQSMLGRTGAEIGIDFDTHDYASHIQGKPNSDFRESYDRSSSTMS